MTSGDGKPAFDQLLAAMGAMTEALKRDAHALTDGEAGQLVRATMRLREVIAHRHQPGGYRIEGGDDRRN